MNAIDARPFPYPLDEAWPCLVIIDMQRDFLEPGGFGATLGNDVSQLQSCIAPVRRLLDTFRALGLPVVHTREAHRPDLGDCPPGKRNRGEPILRIGDEGPMGRILIDGAHGAGIIDELAPLPGEIEIVKPGKGAFYSTGLHDRLQDLKVSRLLVCGVTTEVCVQTTLREANDRGYDCLLVEDATASYFPEFKRTTLDMVTAQGAIAGWVSTTAAVIPALEQRYGAQHHG